MPSPRAHSLASAFILLLVAWPSSQLAAQVLGPPRYRPSNTAMRATAMIDSVARITAPHAPRRLIVDTTNAGSFWFEFEPAALPSALLAPDPATAADRFLQGFTTKVVGRESATIELRRVISRSAGDSRGNPPA